VGGQPARLTDPLGLAPSWIEPIPGGSTGQGRLTGYGQCMVQCMGPGQLVCQAGGQAFRLAAGVGVAAGMGVTQICGLASRSASNCSKQCDAPKPQKCEPLPSFPANTPDQPPIIDLSLG
jgi:hypothetical protein